MVSTASGMAQAKKPVLRPPAAAYRHRVPPNSSARGVSAMALAYMVDGVPAGTTLKKNGRRKPAANTNTAPAQFLRGMAAAGAMQARNKISSPARHCHS